MAWRKQSPPGRTGAGPGAGGGTAGDGGSEISAQLLDFSRGLYPILVQVDTAAFRQYLSAWEDVIGDTTELTATPADQLRRTMAALLRRPQQFGLPAWPATGALDVIPPAPFPQTLPTPLPSPAAATPQHAPAPEPTHTAQHAPAPEPTHTAQHAPAPEPPPDPEVEPIGEDDAQGVYQLDMLTGEFVPITPPPPMAPGSVAETVVSPYDAEVVAPAAAAPTRRRRRRRNSGLEQLSLWPVAG